MDINIIRGVLTAILLVSFVGLWAWAWSGKRRKQFEEAARLPFRDESPVKTRGDEQ